MTIEEYVGARKHLDKEIECKLEQIKELEALATKVSPSSGCSGSGQVSDKVGKTVAKIIDLENEINSAIDKLVDLKAEILQKINLIRSPLHRTMLERKYILGNSIETIAEKTGYSVAQANRVLCAAKEELEKMIQDDTK